MIRIKNDNKFSKFYFDESGSVHTYKIIRTLEAYEKQDFIGEYEEDMYEIETEDGELYHVFDTDILKSEEIDTGIWWRAILNMVDSMEYDEELLSFFIKFCKIEQFAEKYYMKRNK